MSHHLYQSDGFVLGNYPKGEASSLLPLFTRELGLVLVSAQGLRHLKSKLRYSTQAFTLGHFALVRGKEVWRLTGAEAQFQFSSWRSRADQRFNFWARLFKLLSRLLHGEEKNEALFDLLCQTLEFCQRTEHFTAKEIKSLETLSVLRILKALGYWRAPQAELIEFGEHNELSVEILEKFLPYNSRAVLAVNEALKESQL